MTISKIRVVTIGFVAALVLSSPALALENYPTASSCDLGVYDASIISEGQPAWKWIRIRTLHFRIPSSSLWKVATEKIPVFESLPADGGRATNLTFGRPFPSSQGCSYDREYTLSVSPGTSYKPVIGAYEARVERIGGNVVTIFHPTGDTDCPAEHAILMQGGFVLDFMKTCSNLDDESRSIIATLHERWWPLRWIEARLP
jgi:hypothetical protein